MKDIQHTLLLIFGILGLAKALWGLFLPRSAAALLETSTRALDRMHQLAGGALVVLAVGVVAVVLLFQPLAHWLLILLGLMWFAIGLALLRGPETATRWRRWTAARSALWIRCVSIPVLGLALFLIWVALANR